MGPEEVSILVAAIYEAARPVRRYRAPRGSHMRQMRSQAIQALGHAVRMAFNTSDDFEPLLTALFDGLNDKDSSI